MFSDGSLNWVQEKNAPTLVEETSNEAMGVRREVRRKNEPTFSRDWTLGMVNESKSRPGVLGRSCFKRPPGSARPCLNRGK